MGRTPSPPHRSRPRSRSRSRSPRNRRSEDGKRNRYGESRYSPSFGPKGSPDGKERKMEPNYQVTGKLTETAFTRNGVRLKYAEPSEKCRPDRKWRLYVFKGERQLGVVPLYPKTCFRFGRDPKVSDVLIEHESCSKQHAAIQHREVVSDLGYGNYVTTNKPYLIDLESAHGTMLNGKKVEPARFVELKPKDLLRFAHSTREYVVLVEDLTQEQNEES